MASLSVNRATSTLTAPAFIKSAVLIVVGSLVAQLATNWMRNNVVDLSMQGADAVYALTSAFLALAVLPGKYGRPLALGSTATAVRVIADEFGLV